MLLALFAMGLIDCEQGCRIPLHPLFMTIFQCTLEFNICTGVLIKNVWSLSIHQIRHSFCRQMVLERVMSYAAYLFSYKARFKLVILSLFARPCLIEIKRLTIGPTRMIGIWRHLVNHLIL